MILDIPQEPPEGWREEYRGMKVLGKLQSELLTNGPKSLSQSWIMQAMYNDWKRKKGIKDPEPPDCQSSMKEWEESIKKYQTPGQTHINSPMSVIIYQEHCEMLEKENEELKQEILFLKTMLEYKSLGQPNTDINTEEE